MPFSRKDSARPGRTTTKSRRKISLVLAFLLAASVAFVAGEALPASAQSAPTVSRVSASSGPLKGGQIVTITGVDFTGTTGVDFGAVAATDFAVMNDKQIVATVPDASAAGKVLVEVTNATGANTSGAQYEYKAPKITKVDPAFAKKDDDNYVTITGEGLLGTVAADVEFGSDAVTDVWVISDKQIVVKPAKHDGSTVTITDGQTDVVVTRNSVATTPDDKSKFLFVDAAPTITDLVDASDGDATGTDAVDVGDTLTIEGTNLYAITEVKFGTSKVSGDDITLTSATEIDVTVPSKSAGPVDVVVSNAAGDSETNLETPFAFLSTKAPTIKSVYPEALDKTNTTGGGTVLVTGTGLTGVTTAKVTLTCTTGTPTATSATSISDKSLILVLSHNAGNAESCTMSIENPTDNTLTSDDYTIRYI